MSSLRTCFLLLLSVATSLVGAELAVRVLVPQKLAVNVTQWDRHVGFVNKPGAEGSSETSDYSMTVTINSQGLRDREFSYEKSPRSYRIGVFGDSFTFGEGVAWDETYPKVLEDSLNRHPGDDRSGLSIEVINFGIGKTGTSHQLAFYQKEGMRYDLDLVILGFLSGNDFRDNWEGVFSLRDGALVHNPTRYSSVRRIQGLVQRIPFYEWGARHSHLLNLARIAASAHDDRARARDASNTAGGTRAPRGELALTQVELTRRIIEEFRGTVEQDSARFLVVNLPARHQRPIGDYSHVGHDEPIYVRQCDRLMGQLTAEGTHIVDLVPVFQGLSSEQYFFPNDGHMNSRGHQKIAQEIYRAMVGEDLAPN